ncbi:cupin domain-containing protein [Macrococcus animalis]|uniref:cupin domain-containing protein n=1 Tax=Macrococcus animalis TaxID=3395467 RepID=UPI0039BE7AF0
MKYKIIHSSTSESTPNHMILPVIVYQDVKGDFAQIFKQNQWTGIWTDGVFDYHHYHPDTHEVLGVASGEATLMIGGESGSKITVKVGDALLLPAGYGHKRLEASHDFKVVGAYPTDNEVETLTSYDDINAINMRVNNVTLPEQDPIEGSTGPMFKEWHNIYHCNTFLK